MQLSDEAGEPAARVPLGGDYWQTDPGTPLWGFADTHAHLMAHLAFGGRGFWGQPYDPDHPGPDGIANALPSCAPIHGGLFNVNPEFGHPAGGGWPDFIIWPRFTTLVHQQVYVDWLYRAYQGGLRLLVCLAVNNELLASRASPDGPQDDRSAIAIQVAAMKQMAEHIAQDGGGPGQGWLQIVYSPAEAREIVAQDRLAVILGVEVDSLGNWRNHEDLARLSQNDPAQARALIAAELDWLHELGVRQITPIHLTDNAFGGTAIYMRFLEIVNLYVAGHRYDVEDAWQSGVRYRLDYDGADLLDEAERMVALSGPRPRRPASSMHRRTLIDHVPGVESLVEATEAPRVRGGHANARGLTPYGEMVLQEMMARGMVIDVDHMSQKSTDRALQLAEARHYPVICSHTWFRDLAFTADTEFQPQSLQDFLTGDVHKVAHEAGKRGDQIERIAALGGLVAPILNQGDIASIEQALPELAGKTGPACAGSSTSWAQAYLYAVAKMGGRGVAIGSDINGAAGLPGPRFGTMAAYGLRGDAVRGQMRRAQIDAQTNGVSYAEPIRDFRCCRFPATGEGAYDAEERLIWHAIAEYKAGFNPWTMAHAAGHIPDAELLAHLGIIHTLSDQARVDDFARGLWAAEDGDELEPETLQSWPIEQRAAYLARDGAVQHNYRPDARTHALAARIRAMWGQWHAMEGDSPPLVRCKAGPQRDFDINLDGMAHYGLLPDLLQDLRNIGLTPDDLAPLFRSANDYVEMWDQCLARAAEAAG